MLNKFWGSLKSGTDIRGVASEGVVGENITLTDEVVEKIALGFCDWLVQSTGKPAQNLCVAIGHDSRISADRLKKAIIMALSSAGVKVLDCGLSSTPAMFMTTIDLNCDAAIEITASHHPFNRNGLKFFTKNGGLESEDITKILTFASDKERSGQSLIGKAEKVDYMSMYSKRLRDLICREVNSKNYKFPLKGFKIIVDAGNGAGGFYAKDVLEKLGADISGSQFLEPDGFFENHIPNPENKEAMESATKATLEANADLGIIFDTDVDRAGAVGKDGQIINRNTLIALASLIALEDNPGGTIVTDSITSDGLKDYIENVLGGKHHRFKRGYKNVINEAIRLNNMGVNCPLAIETSGHAAMKENFFLDDGAYLITKIVIKMAKLKNQNISIADILSKLMQPKESFEFRLKINTEDFKAYGEKIIKALEKIAQEDRSWILAKDSYEGIKVSFSSENGDGWFLLRLSVHDLVMPINIESNTQGGAKIIAKTLLKALKGFNQLDLEDLQNFII